MFSEIGLNKTILELLPPKRLNHVQEHIKLIIILI